MNKLDALIDACDSVSGIVPDILTRRSAIRRILEAVREDMAVALKECEKRKADATCSYLSDPPCSGPELTCRDCLNNHHAATRQALEAMK